MNIRPKIILIVLPLIVAPLLLTGVIGALSARNGITTVATLFLQFKAEQLLSYAEGQWVLLTENDLQDNERFRQAAEAAVASFAQNLLRSPTELILALDGEARPVMTTGELTLTQEETAALSQLLRSGASGWHVLQLGGVPRVANLASFEPFGWTLLVTEQRGAFYRTVNQIVLRTGLILFVSLSAAVLLLLFLAGILTRPLRNIVEAMTEIISTGDLSRRVEVQYRDETGRLGHTFNLMSAELEKAYENIKGYALQAAVARTKEKRIRNVFQKYVPNHVIQQYLSSPGAMLKAEDRLLAVLFSDIRDFTRISEMLTPESTVEFLNSYFSKVVDIIMDRGGLVDKYMGDGLMAFFGAPVKQENDPLQSVLAGLEMLEALPQFNDEQKGRGLPPIRIGVGINYGVVTVGNIGSERKMDYTTIGDMVNLASRLEALTKKYQEGLIISESVKRRVEREVPCRLLGKVQVLGRERGDPIYAAYRERPASLEAVWRDYHEGTALFYDRRFREAASVFENVLARLPEDGAARVFLEDCRRYIGSPPPENWTGVVRMDTK